MRRAACLGVFAMALAWAAVGQAPAPGASPAPEPLVLRVLAVRGSVQGLPNTQFEPGAEAAGPLVRHLPYDHYAPAVQEERETALGEAAAFALPEGHVLSVLLAEKTPEGLVRTEARVQRTTPEGAALRALDTTALLPPNGVLNLEGVPVSDGELVIFIQLAQKQGGQDDREQPQQGQEEKDEDQPDQQPAQQPEDPKEDTQEEQDPETGERQDMQNIEAILQSLEEMDEREVQDAVKDRREIGIRGGNWW